MKYDIALLVLLASFTICLGLSMKLSRAGKSGCAVWVMFLGPCGILFITWIVMFIVKLCLWGWGV